VVVTAGGASGAGLVTAKGGNGTNGNGHGKGKDGG
jgi:hypothetical protein